MCFGAGALPVARLEVVRRRSWRPIGSDSPAPVRRGAVEQDTDRRGAGCELSVVAAGQVPLVRATSALSF